MSKNIIVTGCSRGVGLEICRVLLEQGNNVYGIARSYTDEFKALEAECPDHVFFKSVDLADCENVRHNVFKDFCSNKVQIDGYVNNAAVAYDDIVTNLNLERLQAMYNVNVFTPMMMTKNVIRNMILHKVKGSIVHISSISVHTGYKGLAMYASSKGGTRSILKGYCSRVGIPRHPLKCRSSWLHGNRYELYSYRGTKRQDLCPYVTQGSY